MQFLRITQYDAAIRQTDAAIRMYLNQEDPVATHTVACAALELLDKLLSQEGMTSMQDDMKSYVIEARRDEIIKKLREPQNFFKHGGEKDKSVKFNPETTEFTILSCCIALDRLGMEFSKEMRVFQFGVSVNNPDLLSEGEYKTKIMKLRESVPTNRRFLTKPELLVMLKQLRDYQK